MLSCTDFMIQCLHPPAFVLYGAQTYLCACNTVVTVLKRRKRKPSGL